MDFEHMTNDPRKAAKQILIGEVMAASQSFENKFPTFLLHNGAYHYCRENNRVCPSSHKYELMFDPDKFPIKDQPHNLSDLLDYISTMRTIVLGWTTDNPTKYTILDIPDEEIDYYNSVLHCSIR